jgi:tetratricopeptide (TPR) repeat protein
MGRRKNRSSRDAKQGSASPLQAQGVKPRSKRWLFFAAVCLATVTITLGLIISRYQRDLDGGTQQAKAPQTPRDHLAASAVQGASSAQSAQPLPSSHDAASSAKEKPPTNDMPAPSGAAPEPGAVDIEALQKETKGVATSLVESFPDNPAALRAMGLVCNAAGERANAAQWWEKALKLAPNRLDLYLLLATLAQVESQHEKVADLCRTGLAKCGPSPALYRGLGIALISLGKPEEAIAPLQHAAEMAPNDSEIPQSLGKAYTMLNQHDKAKESYELAVKLQPGNVFTYYGLAMAYAKLGLEEQSKRALEQYQKLAAENMDVQRGMRGVAHAKQWEKQILSDTCAEAATIYYDQRMLEKAEQLLRRAVAVTPANAAYQTRLAALLANTGRPQDAAPIIQELIRMEPKNARHYSDLAGIYSRLGRWNDAIAAVKAAVQLDPDNGDYRRMLQQLETGR